MIQNKILYLNKFCVIVSPKFWYFIKKDFLQMKKTIFFAALLTFLSKPCFAFNATHDFTVFLGPFNASKTSFNYALDDENYAV